MAHDIKSYAQVQQPRMTHAQPSLIDIWKRVNNKGAWDGDVIANPKFPERPVVDNDMLNKTMRYALGH